MKGESQRALFVSGGFFTLALAVAGFSWATQTVEVPLMVLIGLAVLPTAESSRAAAEAAEYIRRKFEPADPQK